MKPLVITMRATFGAIAALVGVLLVVASVGQAQMIQPGFDYDEATGEVTGTFVSFTFDESTGTITGYTLSSGEADGESVTIFTQVTIENFTAEVLPGMPALETQIFAAGAVWAAIGANATVSAIDNPVGNLGIANIGLMGAPMGFDGDIGAIGGMDLTEQFLESRNTVTFTLASGLQATFEGPEPQVGGGFVNITGPDFRGFIFVSAGSLSVNGDTIIAKLEGPEAVFFHALPLFGMEQAEMEFEDELAEAAARGDVGARIDIDAQGRALKSPFRTSFQLSVQAALKNRVTLEISSEDPEGTIIVLDVSGDLVDLDKEIRVLLDDAEVEHVASLELLIEAKSQGVAQPKVYLLKTTDELKLSIYVPGFSTKTLTVEAVEAPPEAEEDVLATSTIWIVVGIAAVIIVVGAVVALRRRK